VNKKSVFIIILFFLFFVAEVFAEDGINIGDNVPDFRVISGDNQELTLEMLKGKTIVLFYETRDAIEKNRKLKNRLNKFYYEQTDKVKQSVVRVAVIDCSKVFPLFVSAWKSSLVENSKKEGIIIYGDWNGKMFKDYNMKDKNSNFLIIDKKAVLRYFYAGAMGDNEIARAEDLLKNILDEK